jgi:hypothetical protein
MTLKQKMKKPSTHGSFKNEQKALKMIKSLQSSDSTRTYYIHKRLITTVSGGHKIRYQIRANKQT